MCNFTHNLIMYILYLHVLKKYYIIALITAKGDLSMDMALILAGGQGKRMKTDKPKALMEVLGIPMIGWVLDACNQAGISEQIVIKGFAHEMLQEYLDSVGNIKTAYQSERLGTGHAVMCGAELIRKAMPENVIILCADAPFIDSDTISKSLEYHKAAGNSVTVVTADIPSPFGYGRIIRDGESLLGIVEQRDCTEEQTKITEVNSGCFWFKTEDLLESLGKLSTDNSQGEYYLTDTVGILVSEGKKAGAFKTANKNAVLGANDRVGLLRLADVARHIVIDRLAEKGVDFVSSEGIIISPRADIEAGATILPNTIIDGESKVYTGAVVGPNTRVTKSIIRANAKVDSSVLDSCDVGENCDVGPFARLRPNAVLKDYAHVGNFAEIKNSTLGVGTAVSHLTYIGDSEVGSNVNFGCGVAVANYNGDTKNLCVVKDDAFIGCHTNLISPVTVGEGAYVGANSTITKDVPDGALAVERGELRIFENQGRKRLSRHLAKGEAVRAKVKAENK